MTAPSINPLTGSSQNPTQAGTSNRNSIPPDVANARKTRINRELISLFKRPCPPGAASTAKGIGLYTHIEGPIKTPQFPHQRYLPPEPQFLPLGGPKEVKKRKGLGAQMDNEVRRVWHEVREAVEEEQKITRATEMSTIELTKRYGGLDVPERAFQKKPEAQTEQLEPKKQSAVMQSVSTRQKKTITPEKPGLVGRRPPLGGASGYGSALHGSENVRESEPKRKGSVANTGNTYDAARDPRRRPQ